MAEYFGIDISDVEEFLDLSYLKKMETKYELTVKGNELIDQKRYYEAIDYYHKILNHELFINDYHPYLKLANVYHALGKYDEEVNILTDFFKSGRYCRKSKLRWFKRRLNLLSGLGYFDYTELSSLENIFNLKGYKNRRLSRIPVPTAKEIKREHEYFIKEYSNLDPMIFDDFVNYDEDLSIKSKIKFKHKLIQRGDELISKKSYPMAIAYYSRLLNHTLFVNDYHPYLKLVNRYKTRQRLNALRVIVKFFKSGIYCNKNKLNWFKRQLAYLSKYGFFDYSKIKYLEKEFQRNALPNKSISNVPVPISIEIKNAFSLSFQDEDAILEHLENLIPQHSITDELKNESISQNHQENLKNNSNEGLNTEKTFEFNSKEREQMIKVLEGIESGQSRTQAAKNAGCSPRKLFKWIDNGKNKKDENTTYFYNELIKIDKKRMENKASKSKFKPIPNNPVDSETTETKIYQDNVKVNEIIINEDIQDENVNKLIFELKNYLKQPFYKMDIRKYNLSNKDIEIVKNKIIDDIIQKKVTGDIKIIFKSYCKDYAENKNVLPDDEFEKLFSDINTSEYDDLIVEECKTKTIEEYNSNKINKSGVTIRFKYLLKRKTQEKNQLNTLENIKADPHLPKNKVHLTLAEQNHIYNLTNEKICSEHGLSGRVIDFVEFEIFQKIEKNKSDARKKLSSMRYNRKNFMEISGLKSNQIDDFTKQMEFLIDQNQIKENDINEELIQELGSNYLNSGKIF